MSSSRVSRLAARGLSGPATAHESSELKLLDQSEVSIQPPVTNHSSPAPPVAQLQTDVPLAARHASVVEIHGAGVRVADAASKGDFSEDIYQIQLKIPDCKVIEV